MTYTVRLREEAEYDLESAAVWYESQKRGLGHEFLDVVSGMLESIERNPMSFPVVHRDIHRAVIPRFPFSIFYIVRGLDVSVVSVMHGSRHPSRWKGRS
jgi:plasmid stabilization system protein ParE